MESIKLNIQEINRQIKISVFLPNSYHFANKRFRVCYIFDFQNFKHTSIIDELNNKDIVVIGINQIYNNILEYNFNYRNNNYEEVFLKHIKGNIENIYKVLGDKEDIILAGSDKSALMAYYLGLNNSLLTRNILLFDMDDFNPLETSALVKSKFDPMINLYFINETKTSNSIMTILKDFGHPNIYNLVNDLFEKI